MITKRDQSHLKASIAFLEKGPYWDSLTIFNGLNKEQLNAVKQMYKIWSETWVIPPLEQILENNKGKSK